MDVVTKFFSAGIPLAATLHIPDTGNEMLVGQVIRRVTPDAAVMSAQYPAVVLCHGSYRHKDDGLDRYAEVLGTYGIVSLRFDIRGHGEETPFKYRLLPSAEMAYDLFCAFNYLESFPFVDRSRFGISGVSLGGALSIQMAGSDRRVKSAVPMASPAGSRHDDMSDRWGKRTAEIMDMLYEDARINAVTGVSRIINREILRSGEETEASRRVVIDELLWSGNCAYTTLEAVRDMMNLFPLDYAKEITCPTLIMHGKSDELIPYKNAQLLFDAIPGGVRKEIRLYDGVVHNMPKDENRELIFKDAAEWFSETL